MASKHMRSSQRYTDDHKFAPWMKSCERIRHSDQSLFRRRPLVKEPSDGERRPMPESVHEGFAMTTPYRSNQERDLMLEISQFGSTEGLIVEEHSGILDCKPYGKR